MTDLSAAFMQPDRPGSAEAARDQAAARNGHLAASQWEKHYVSEGVTFVARNDAGNVRKAIHVIAGPGNRWIADSTGACLAPSEQDR